MGVYADDILLHRQIRSVSDYLLIQQDIDALQDWLKYNHLDLNSTKCKYMTISRKRTSLQPVFCLSISGHPLERVTAFKYLGVWISDNLTWSRHIEHAVKRATKKTGMIFRRFYTSSNTATLKQLYLSFVRPHLEYTAQVWDPHLRTHINSPERVQRFALRMCCKNWSEPYDALLARTDLPTLSKRRKFLKVSYFFQVISGTFHSPNAPITTHPTNTRLRNSSTTALKPIFARTDTYKFSFYPNTISLWNNLPDDV